MWVSPLSSPPRERWRPLLSAPIVSSSPATMPRPPSASIIHLSELAKTSSAFRLRTSVCRRRTRLGPTDLSVGPASVRARYTCDPRSLFDRQRRSLLRLIASLRRNFSQFSRRLWHAGYFTPFEFDDIYSVLAPFADVDESSISASETSWDTLPEFPPPPINPSNAAD